MFLIFTSLNWINNCFAGGSHNASTFKTAQKEMHAQEHCGVEYNTSKTAAIVGAACGKARYINFQTKKTYTIAKQYRGFSVKWLDDNTVTLEAGCGTGCIVAYIFIAPATVVYCPVHEYRIDFLDPHEPPDYYHNRPLLVDPKRRVYVCYDENNTIQVYPFPRHASIRPPKGYFTEKASMVNGKLVVQYANRHGQKQRIAYR